MSGHLFRDTDRVSASESLNSVMGEELQLKIAENARLHAALDGVDKRYSAITIAFQYFFGMVVPPIFKCLGVNPSFKICTPSALVLYISNSVH